MELPFKNIPVKAVDVGKRERPETLAVPHPQKAAAHIAEKILSGRLVKRPEH